MKSHAFTWEKSRGTTNFIEERLDRVLITSGWFNLFRNAEVLNLEVETSDHSALLLRYGNFSSQSRKRFRFENYWVSESDCKEVVRYGWMEHDAENRKKLSGADMI